MDSELLDVVGRKLGFPPNATLGQVLAAANTDLNRRAAMVGLSEGATLDEIRAAERAAVSAREAWRVAAAGAVGHQVPAEQWHPAASPGHRQPRSTSAAVDWAALLSEGDE